MKGNVGVWLDHHEALVVTVDGDRTSLCRLPSHVELQSDEETERWGAHARGGAVTKEGSEEARYREQMHSFYHEIMEVVGDADGVIICGPGQARIELLTEMKLAGSDLRHLVAATGAPRMSENQLVAWFREAFHEAPDHG